MDRNTFWEDLEADLGDPEFVQEFKAAFATSLKQVGGGWAPIVALMTGMTLEELEELGGMPAEEGEEQTNA